jgi:uncharacterized membrane protein affecting hemolysin expression
MIKLLRQMLVIAMMIGVVSTGAFAQGRGRDKDKRPPKETVKVITNDRKDNNRPPRQNDNQKPKPDNRKRPFF